MADDRLDVSCPKCGDTTVTSVAHTLRSVEFRCQHCGNRFTADLDEIRRAYVPELPSESAPEKPEPKKG